MEYKKELIELVKKHTEDNIDITDNWNDWEKFLIEQNIIKTYDEVYEMDLNHLRSCGHDYGDAYITDDGEWDVESLIDNDQDITLMSNGYYFVHNQQYIDDYIIDLFYEQQEEKKKQKNLNWSLNQAYIDLDQSKNGFNRFDALLFIFGHNFGNQKLYFASDINKIRRELLKCIQKVLIERNKIEEKKESEDNNYAPLYLDLWLPNRNAPSNEDDEHYCELIRFGGYEILEDGHQILESDAILLMNDDGIYTLDYFKYENMNHFCDYIAEVFEFFKNDCFDVGGKAYEQETNKKINNIIDDYWKNTIEFNYSEFYSNI